MKKRIAAWIALGLITLGSGFLLSMTNEMTKGTIEKQEAESKVVARQAVLSAAERFEVLEISDLSPLTELYAGMVGDEVIGYVGTAVTTGYGGPVQVIAGIDNDGKVSGISVGSSDFNETAGLGAKAKDASFVDQFVGKQTPVRAVKAVKDRADNTVDAITAATITTNAVTGAVNQVAGKIDAYLNPDDGALAEGTTYTADTLGYAGPVAVFVTVKDDGTISALNIGDERFAETQGFGAAAKEPGFTKQFIGKSLPLTIGDVDAISGATKTSQAVIDALNKAFEDKVIVEAAAPDGITYTAAEKGFAGPVAVFVTVDDNSVITALTIGDDKFAETQGYGAGAQDRTFTKQFIGETLPITIEDIDTISGATITSKAVVAGINRAYDEKLIDDSANVSAVETAASEVPSATEAPALTGDLRTATSSSKGYEGPVAVTIMLNDDNTIASLVVGDADFAETVGLGSRAQDEEFTSQFIGKKVPLQEGDIDVIASATITSEAVIKAVNKAAEKLMPTQAEEATVQTALREATSSSKGYDGPVAVTLTLNEDNTIAKIVVGDANFNETVGLGSRAQDEEFTSQFIGKTVPLQVGDVDVIASATITSEAVIKAVNKAAEKLMPEQIEKATEQTTLSEATSSSKGYDGPVAVTLTLNEDNTIAKIVVGDADFNETPGLGSRAQDEEFTSQFIGKKVPLQEGDIDVIASATITSEAVIKAVNKAAEKLMPTQAEEATVQTALREATSSSKGYDGPVAVTIMLNEDDTIASLVVGDADFSETVGLGSRAQDEEFTSQFIGKKVPLQEGDIDVIASATITSEAVIKAVNKAAEKLMPTQAEEATVQTALREATSSSKGYDGPVAVTLTLNGDNTIAKIVVGDADFNETPGLGSRAQDEEFTSQFIGKKVPLQEGDIDVIASATITSEAVIKAVNKAAEKLMPVVLREATSSSKGYNGPVAVTLTLDEEDVIVKLIVGDADFDETVGLGSKAQDEEFTNQFIGKKVPLQVGDVDVISGATVTSEAVIKAVSKAAEKLMPVVLREATSTSKGYNGPVAVTVTLDEEDVIIKLLVGDADFDETAGLGSKAQDEDFISQFIGKKVPLKVSDVDVISGATITSEAVVKAVNKAAEKLLQK